MSNPKGEPMPSTLTGGCLCGAIRNTISAPVTALRARRTAERGSFYFRCATFARLFR
jgi:hypothetical protein